MDESPSAASTGPGPFPCKRGRFLSSSTVHCDLPYASLGSADGFRLRRIVWIMANATMLTALTAAPA